MDKSKITVRPIGLKGREAHERMIELMGVTPIKENFSRSAVELTKKGPDGKVYGIIRENHEWYIKVSEGDNLTKESFQYIGGLANKKDFAYPSYAKAIKHLNQKFQSLNEALGVKGNINVFRNDNLLSEEAATSDGIPLRVGMRIKFVYDSHTYDGEISDIHGGKATIMSNDSQGVAIPMSLMNSSNTKLDVTEGIINVFRNDNLLSESDAQKHVLDKKGKELDDENAPTDNENSGTNLTGKTGKKKADKDFKKVTDGDMVDMTEEEKRIDAMISGEEYVGEVVEESMLGAASFFQGDDIVLHDTLSISYGVDTLGKAIANATGEEKELEITEATKILSKLSKEEVISILEHVTGKKKV